MSKPVKELLQKELTGRLDGVASVAVVDLTGIDANTTNDIRARLIEKSIRLSVVKNSLARRAFKDVGLDIAVDLLDGPCALAWGADSIIAVLRELRDISKEVSQLGLKGALLDGDVFGPERMIELANYPTREEAIGQVIGAATAPASQVVSCLIAPGGAIASLLKTIEEQIDEPPVADAPAADAPAEEAFAEEPAGEAAADEAPAEESPADDASAEGDEAKSE